MKPEMVYLVTSGDYSDYRVEAVFFERAEADLFVAWGGEPGTYDAWTVEEWRVGFPAAYRPGTRPWRVIMARNAASRVAPSAGMEESEGPITAWARGRPFRAWTWEVFARDAQHAVKIANERRAWLIATGEWDRVFAQRRWAADVPDLTGDETLGGDAP